MVTTAMGPSFLVLRSLSLRCGHANAGFGCRRGSGDPWP
jgi:hypothetical protein